VKELITDAKPERAASRPVKPATNHNHTAVTQLQSKSTEINTRLQANGHVGHYSLRLRERYHTVQYSTEICEYCITLSSTHALPSHFTHGMPRQVVVLPSVWVTWYIIGDMGYPGVASAVTVSAKLSSRTATALRLVSHIPRPLKLF